MSKKNEGFIKSFESGEHSENKEFNFSTKKREIKETLHLSDDELTQVIYIALQHGQTDGNIKNITKSNSMPLNKTGIKNTQIKAQELKSLLGPEKTNDIGSILLVSFPHFIKRDIQTARTYCKALDLEFPKDETLEKIRESDQEYFLFKSIFEILTYKDNPKFQLPQIEEKLVLEGTPESVRNNKFKILELIEPLINKNNNVNVFKEGENKSLQRLILENSDCFDKDKVIEEMNKSNIKMIDLYHNFTNKFPYLRCESGLGTRKKGLKGSGEKFPKYTDKLNKSGTEGGMEATIRSAKYYKQQISETLGSLHNKENKVIVSIGHRTGNTAFKKLIEGSDTYDPKEHGNWNTSSTVVGYLNKETYEENSEKKGNKFLNSPGSNLFTFDIKEYNKQIKKIKKLFPSINLSKDIFDNQNRVNAYLKSVKNNNFTIRRLLNKAPHPLVRPLLIHLSREGNSNEVIDFLDKKLLSHNAQEQKTIIKELYLLKDSKAYQYAIYLLLDKEDLLEEIKSELDNPEKFSETINKLNYNQDIINEKINTITGKKSLQEVYIPPTINDKEASYDNEEDFLKKVLQGNKKIHTVQGSSGSGKSLLLESIIKKMHNLSFLKKLKAWDFSAVKIDKNMIHENFSLDEYLENFDSSNVLLCIDGLDEIDTGTMKKLYNTITSEEFTAKYPNCKIIVSSRYFEKKWENKSINNYQLESLETKNKVNQMINKYSQTLSPKKSETFKKVIHKLIHNLGNTITPIHIAMISGLMNNREFVKNIFKEEIELSDLYKYFVETIINHQEDKITTEKELKEYEENPFNSIEYEDLKLDFISYLAVYCSKEIYSGTYPKSFIQIVFWQYIQKNKLYEKILGRKINQIEKFILSTIEINYDSINITREYLSKLKEEFIKKNKLDEKNKEMLLSILSMDIKDILLHQTAHEAAKKHLQLSESLFSTGLLSKVDDNVFGKPEELDYYGPNYPKNQKETDAIKDINQGFDFIHKSLNRYFGYKFYSKHTTKERNEILIELTNESGSDGVNKRLRNQNEFLGKYDITGEDSAARVDLLSFPLFNTTQDFIKLLKDYEQVGIFEKVSSETIDALVKENFKSNTIVNNKEFFELFDKNSDDYVTIYNIIMEGIDTYRDQFSTVGAAQNLNGWMEKFYAAIQSQDDKEIINLLNQDKAELELLASRNVLSPAHIIRKYIEKKFGI